ncbi:hypothetical protein pb186bvf_011054 [Paramecium bursaria]
MFKRNHNKTEMDSYLFQRRKDFDPYLEMLWRQKQEEQSQFKRLFNKVPSSRIHAEHLKCKTERYQLKTHQRRRKESSDLKLPTLGDSQRKEKIPIKFPPYKKSKLMQYISY